MYLFSQKKRRTGSRKTLIIRDRKLRDSLLNCILMHFWLVHKVGSHFYELVLTWSAKDEGINITQKLKFYIKDFFSECDQIRSFLRIWSHLLQKYLMEKKLHFLCSKMQYFFQSYHSVLIIKVIRIYQIGNNGPRNEKERILKSWKNFILINAKTFVNWFLSLRGSLYETFARFGTTI